MSTPRLSALREPTEVLRIHERVVIATEPRKGAVMKKTRVMLSLPVLLFLILAIWGDTLEAAECHEPVPVPTYQVGEKWTWRDEKSKEWSHEVVQVDGEFTHIKLSGERVAFVDKDWVLQRLKKANGELVTKQGAGQNQFVGQKILDFPLQTGKGWEFDYYSQPVGGGLSQYYLRSEILGCEEVRTPAGTFAALKIEVDQGRRGINWSGKYVWWYAPQVKTGVRRQYIPSRFWHTTRDYELIKFEIK